MPAVAPARALVLSLVIPTFNERENISVLVRQLSERLDPVLGTNYELIIVDDDSPDRTWELATELAAQYPCLRVVRRVGERGLSTAVIRGWQSARGAVLGVIDADLQHPPEVAVSLWNAVHNGSDLAVGSRHLEDGGVSDWSVLRRALSRGAQLIGLIVLPGVVGRISDPMSGYFMVRREAIAGVELSPLGYKILIEVLGRGHVHSIREVGYVFRERHEGRSKVSWRLYVEYLRHLVRLRVSNLHVRRFLRFTVVGATGVIVDMAVLYLLSDPHTLGLGLTRSKVVAAELAIVNNFLWNDSWTFRDFVGSQRGFANKLHRFVKFNVVCGLGLLLNVVLLNVMFNLLHMNRYVANLIAISLVTLWNYWVNVKLHWRSADARAAP